MLRVCFRFKAPEVSSVEVENSFGREPKTDRLLGIEGELEDLVEEFSEGRVQFAFVRVRDPNTSLAKNVFIAWCGDGVPEWKKGYFTSHSQIVAKTLQVSERPTIPF